jgi:hypothetical protein
VIIAKTRTQALFVKDGWVWYLDERNCTSADSCPGATEPTGRVYGMNLATGVEQLITFAAGEGPVGPGQFPVTFAPGDFWPAT